MSQDKNENQVDLRENEEITEEEVEEWFESEEETSEETSEPIDVVARYSEAQLRIVRTNMDLSLHNLRQSLQDASAAWQEYLTGFCLSGVRQK